MRRERTPHGGGQRRRVQDRVVGDVVRVVEVDQAEVNRREVEEHDRAGQGQGKRQAAAASPSRIAPVHGAPA